MKANIRDTLIALAVIVLIGQIFVTSILGMTMHVPVQQMNEVAK